MLFLTGIVVKKIMIFVKKSIFLVIENKMASSAISKNKKTAGASQAVKG